MTETPELKVLLVEDNPGDALLLQETVADIQDVRLRFTHRERLGDALKQLESDSYAAILLDLMLPDSSGLETLARAREAAPNVPIVVLTSLGTDALGVEAVQLGAQDYLNKADVNGAILVRATRHAIERQQVLEHLEEERRRQLVLKDDFLSHVSHELRTPVGAIYQFLSILDDGLAGELTTEQREYVEIALRNVAHLKSMIGDLLEVTRAGSGKLTVTPRRIELAGLINDCLDTVSAEAAVKSVDLSYDVAPDLPEVYADPDRVQQIVDNLLTNAIKFTPEKGSVRVAAMVHEADGDYIRVTVVDTGIGIDGERVDKIFDRLYQVANTVEDSRKGLGLGLYIVKQLVERHGGHLWVESSPGRGSSFHFTLPVFSLARVLVPVLASGWGPGDQVAVITLRPEPGNGTKPDVTDAVVGEAMEVLRRHHEHGEPQLVESGGLPLPFMVVQGGHGAAVAAAVEKDLEDGREADRASVRWVVSVRTVTIPGTEQCRSDQERAAFFSEVARGAGASGSGHDGG